MKIVKGLLTAVAIKILTMAGLVAIVAVAVCIGTASSATDEPAPRSVPQRER